MHNIINMNSKIIIIIYICLFIAFIYKVKKFIVFITKTASIRWTTFPKKKLYIYVGIYKITYLIYLLIQHCIIIWCYYIHIYIIHTGICDMCDIVIWIQWSTCYIIMDAKSHHHHTNRYMLYYCIQHLYVYTWFLSISSIDNICVDF